MYACVCVRGGDMGVGVGAGVGVHFPHNYLPVGFGCVDML